MCRKTWEAGCDAHKASEIPPVNQTRARVSTKYRVNYGYTCAGQVGVGTTTIFFHTYDSWLMYKCFLKQ